MEWAGGEERGPVEAGDSTVLEGRGTKSLPKDDCMEIGREEGLSSTSTLMGPKTVC